MYTRQTSSFDLFFPESGAELTPITRTGER